MVSPARAHYERLSAASAAAGMPAAQPTTAGVRILAMLRAHQASLKGIQSLKAKIAAGDYQIDARNIAEKMLKEDADLFE